MSRIPNLGEMRLPPGSTIKSKDVRSVDGLVPIAIALCLTGKSRGLGVATALESIGCEDCLRSAVGMRNRGPTQAKRYPPIAF